MHFRCVCFVNHRSLPVELQACHGPLLARACVCLSDLRVCLCLCVCVCVAVEGQWYLAEDMRLLCYTGQWWGYAIYGITMIGVYVVGLPLGILLILSRHRATLYGPDSKETMRKYGFLYDTYGPNAWFWETEELFRKLMLTAVAVLMNPANPMQVCLRPLVAYCDVLGCNVSQRLRCLPVGDTTLRENFRGIILNGCLALHYVRAWWGHYMCLVSSSPEC